MCLTTFPYNWTSISCPQAVVVFSMSVVNQSKPHYNYLLNLIDWTSIPPTFEHDFKYNIAFALNIDTSAVTIINILTAALRSLEVDVDFSVDVPQFCDFN